MSIPHPAATASDRAGRPLPSFEGIPTTEPHGPDFEQIPADLKALPQWVCWRLEERAGDTTKVPYKAESGRRARSNDPTTWTIFNTTVDAYLRGGYAGVGFMFWEGDGLTGLDLDHVIDPETGEIDPRALEILERFKGTYCEISPSGTGFRIFTRGSPGRSGKNEGRGKWLEVYTHPSHRYLTVTGHHWPQSAVEVTAQQDALDWLHEKYLTKPDNPKPATKPATAPNLGIDDSDLLDKARAAANGHQFGQLWNGDTTAHRGDHSCADLALCSLLAFWTGKDADRMDRLFRQSGLMRPKWERADYRQRTIDKAIAECLEVYTEGRKDKGGNGHDQAPPTDYSDYPEAQSTSPERAGSKPRQTADSRKNKPRIKPKIHNGDALSTMEFPPLRWAIEGILPAGATLFAGLPKKGKSRLTLNVGYAVSSGGYALGKIKVDQGEALYIALDDQKRRILEILKAMSPNSQIPTGLHVAFEWPRLGDGCEDELNDWLYHHREYARFVCLDVIKHVRQIGTNKNPYLEDYAVGDALRTIAEEYQVAITGNHHTNKLAFAIEEGDDPMQAISGTSGLPGGFDNTMILYQRRGIATTFLHIEGNDTQNADLALEWDDQLLTWGIAGDAEEFTGGPEWQRAKALLRQHGPLGVIDLAKLLYPDVKEIADDSTEYNRVKRLLWKAKQKGRVIVRRFDKRYQLPHEKA